MVVHLFKTRQPGYYAVLWLISISVYCTSLRFEPAAAPETGMPLYQMMMPAEGSVSPWFFMAGLLLFMLQGLQVHLLVNQFEVLYKPSFLPWLMYILLMSLFPGMLKFTPALIANSFLLIMLDRLFRIYKCEYAQGYHFEAAAMLSLAACIYLPAAGFILLLIASILLLHPFDWRNWVSACLGFLSPVYLLAVVLFLAGRTDRLMPEPFKSGLTWKIEWNHVLPQGAMVTVVCVLVLYTLSILMLREHFYKNTSRTRSFQQVIVLYSFVALLISLFTPTMPVYKLVMPAIPISIVTGYYLLALKKNWMADTVFLLIMALAVFNQISLPFDP